MKPKRDKCKECITSPAAQEIRGNYLYTNGRPLGGQDNYGHGDTGTIHAGRKK